MAHGGKVGLAGWMGTTRLPYAARVSALAPEGFTEEPVTRRLKRHPLDLDGQAHAALVGLEVGR